MAKNCQMESTVNSNESYHPSPSFGLARNIRHFDVKRRGRLLSKWELLNDTVFMSQNGFFLEIREYSLTIGNCVIVSPYEALAPPNVSTLPMRPSSIVWANDFSVAVYFYWGKTRQFANLS